MSVLKLFIAPHKVLKTKSDDVPVDDINEELIKFMDDMSETMYSNKGVGLAAIQVGVPIRVLVTALKTGEAGRDLRMINPKIIKIGEEDSVCEEGCLSVPMLIENVTRKRDVTVSYIDESGDEKVRSFSNEESHLIQHEIDHMDGVTMLDKVSRLKRDIYKRKIKKIRKKIQRGIL